MRLMISPWLVLSYRPFKPMSTRLGSTALLAKRMPDRNTGALGGTSAARRPLSAVVGVAGAARRSEERRVGKSVDLGGSRIIQKKNRDGKIDGLNEENEIVNKEERE